jgi:hypothetical protein
VNKTEFIRLEFFMDPSNPASKYACYFVIFKDGCAEERAKWLMAYHEIESLMPLKDSAEKSNSSKTMMTTKPPGVQWVNSLSLIKLDL